MVSRTGKINISLSPFAPDNLVLRDGFGSAVLHQHAHLHTQGESGAYGIPLDFPGDTVLYTSVIYITYCRKVRPDSEYTIIYGNISGGLDF